MINNIEYSKELYLNCAQFYLPEFNVKTSSHSKYVEIMNLINNNELSELSSEIFNTIHIYMAFDER
jgi:hypothetical protein